MGLRDKLRGLKEKVLENIAEEAEFSKDVEKFWGLTKEERDTYLDLIKQRNNLVTRLYYCETDRHREQIEKDIDSLAGRIANFILDKKEGVA